MAGKEMSKKYPGMVPKTIGTVRSEIKKSSTLDFKNVISEIVIDSRWSEALDNIDEFSHIIVLYWMHQLKTKQVPIKVRPMGTQGLELKGVLATRSPNRPNPIGKTTVRLLQRQGNVLKVRGLDAIDGSPVIDIKPYIPGYDSTARAKVPPWVSKR